MGTSKIVLTRIDNRLIHGQVGVNWTSISHATMIAVVDDEVVKDPLQTMLMRAVAKSVNEEIHFYSTQEFIEKFKNSEKDHRIFLVVKKPTPLVELVRNGILLDRVNLGNMHYTKGKKALTKKVYLDEIEEKELNELLDAGVELFAQDIPGTQIVEVTHINLF